MNLSYIYIIYEDYTCMQKVDKDIDSHKMQRSPPSDGKEQSQKKVIYWNILKQEMMNTIMTS